MPRLAMMTVCAIGAALAASTASAQQEINLTVAAGQPLRAMKPLAMVSEFYIPEVEKRIKAAGLNIKINWKEAYAGSLLKPTFVLQGVQDGIADVGFEPTIFHPDKLPLEQITFVTPFVTTDVVLVGKTMDKLHATIPAMGAQYDKFGVIRIAGSRSAIESMARPRTSTAGSMRAEWKAPATFSDTARLNPSSLARAVRRSRAGRSPDTATLPGER